MSVRGKQDGSSMRRYNIVVLGAGGTGKSALSVRFKHGIFMDKYDPTIEDMYVKMVKVDGQKCVVQVIDTAGNEQFNMHHDLYLKNGEGFVLVYSITARSTFNDLQGLRQRILKVKGTKDAPILLVGNKCDLEDKRMVFKEEGHSLAQLLSCPFLESSAKAKVNVEEIFHEIVRQVNLKTPESDNKTDKNCMLL